VIVQQEVKKLPKSSVALTLTVSKDASRLEYETLLKRYSKNVVLPGFRKGKVPSSVLEQKFGEGLKVEALQEVVDKALHEAFEKVEDKPLSYSQPRIVDKELKLDLEQDLTFTLEYDVYPVIKLGDYKGVEIEVPQVALAAEDEARELERLRDQNSMLVEKTSGKVALGDTVTINYVELDEEEKPIEVTQRQDFVFTVGSGLNYYKLDQDLVGWSKGEASTIVKTYPADFEDQDLAGSTKKILVTLTQLKEKKLPDLDDDFAQDINENYKNLADLKNAIHERLTKNLETQIKNRNVEALLDKIATASVFELPESMIQAEMEQTWNSFANQSRMDSEQMERIIGQEGKRKLFEDWRPQSEAALRRRMVMEKIIEIEKVDADEVELKAEIQKQADLSKMTFADTQDYFEKNGLKDYLAHEIRDRKLGDFLLASAKIKKGKKMSYLDLTERKD
jgi:trigger factor